MLYFMDEARAKEHGELFTSVFCTGVLCAAAMMSTAGRVLSEKIDVLQLAFYTAPVSSCVLLPFFWFLEVRTSAPKSKPKCT